MAHSVSLQGLANIKGKLRDQHESPEIYLYQIKILRELLLYGIHLQVLLMQIDAL